MKVKPCLFCSEPESFVHLFFECVVSKRIWGELSSLLGLNLGWDFESVAKLWLCNKNHGIVNMFPSAVLWGV